MTALIQMTKKIRYTPAELPNLVWNQLVNTGNNCARAKVVPHKKKDTTATALLRILFGKISETIIQLKGPKPKAKEPTPFSCLLTIDLCQYPECITDPVTGCQPPGAIRYEEKPG